jgi:hypothetical protein
MFGMRKREQGNEFSNTIVVILDDNGEAPVAPELSPQAKISDVVVSQKSFKIRLADTEAGRNSASMLIDQLYSWRGYSGSHQLQETPNRITLTASDKDMVVGTVTLGFDSPAGMLADVVFKDEIDIHRKQGRKVCELTKLAFDPTIRSKLVLASLFHIAFIYGRRIHRCTDVFIEVNPRHRLFYERMLGFQRQGEMKLSPRVKAPAYLLWLDLDYVEEQIARYGGTNNHPETTRSLYPFFFSRREEEGISQRLVDLD